jgi:glycosyltransferase involved in cell wall biosynthesis
MPDIAGEGAYYANPTDHVAFADAMLRLYKDEGLRSRLATEALRRAGAYTAAPATETVMQVLEEAPGGK